MGKNHLNRISIEEEISGYLSIVKALSINYLNVFVVKPETNSGRIIKLNGYVTDGIIDVANDFDYFEMLKKYANKRVYKDDIPFFLNELKPENVIKQFAQNEEQIEFSYRVIQDDEIHFCSAHYIKISQNNEPLRLVAGFRNIDKIIESRAKERENGMSKAYQALANVYYSMYRINLEKGTFKDIKTCSEIKKYQLPNSNDYTANINSILKNVVKQSFYSVTKEFCDLRTLEERMKDRNSISLELIGIYTGWVRISFIKEDLTKNGNISHVLFTIQIIDDIKQRENELRILAETDQLTGLLNRGTGERKIKEAIDLKEEGVFLLMDVDRFKAINDSYGHETGDFVIREIADCLKEAFKDKRSIIMRLGGDEFAVYLHGRMNEEDVSALWKEMTKSFEKISPGEKKENRICLSAGYTTFDGSSDDDFNSLYKKADDALYLSKKTEGFKLTFGD